MSKGKSYVLQEAEHRFERAMRHGDEPRVVEALDRKAAIEAIAKENSDLTAPDVEEPEHAASAPLQRTRRTKVIHIARKRRRR